jgi:hypothetical protein
MYIGNCTNSFDAEGNCLFNIFRDVSEFAQREEEIQEALDEGRDILLSQEDFECIEAVDLKALGNVDFRNFEFYFYPQTETSPQVFVAYDELEDIHYFFA